MTIIANLLVCVLVLMALSSLWILLRVWVNRWIASNQSDDCPPVMHSRHSKDAHEMLMQHLKEAGLETPCSICKGKGRLVCPGAEFLGPQPCAACSLTMHDHCIGELKGYWRYIPTDEEQARWDVSNREWEEEMHLRELADEEGRKH